MYKKWFLAITVLFLAVSLPLTNSVFASSEMWSQTYGGPGTDIAYSLIATAEGGYALAGCSLLVKTDANGTMLWNQSFSEGHIRSLIVKSDGGYALAGGGLLVETNANGVMKWNRTYEGNILSLVITSDGGYAMAGDIRSDAERHYDFLLIKTDEQGNMLWNKTYGESSYEYAYSLVEDSDGGYVLAGRTSSAERSDNFWVVKTDADGNMEWNQTFGGAGDERAFSLVESSDGGYAIAGWVQTYYGLLTNFWLVKIDDYGNMLWNQTYSGVDVIDFSLIQTSDGGYAIAGGNKLVKADAFGNIEWNQTYDGSAYSLVETSDGGYAIAGEQSDDFWLAKTDKYGIIPEFPSWVLVPLLSVAPFVVILCNHKLPRKPRNI